MKLILKDNLINEVKNVDDKTKEKSVVYFGYTLKGDNIEVYDLDNGSIKPVVRYLMTGTTGKKSYGLIIIVVLLVLLLAGILIFSYYYNNKETKPVINTKPQINTEIIKTESQVKIKNDIEKEKEKNKIIMQEVEKPKIQNNDVELNNKLQLAYLDLEILQKKYDNLQRENTTLKDKIALLQKENEELKNKNDEIQTKLNNTEINSFIYFLGQEVKKNCDKNNITKEKCVDLYNKYLKTIGKEKNLK